MLIKSLAVLILTSAGSFAAVPDNTSTDLEITQRLHDVLMLRTDLSNFAQNIRIITLGGKTVLSGPVASLAEKRRVDAIAHEVIGKESEIDDELTVAQ